MFTSLRIQNFVTTSSIITLTGKLLQGSISGVGGCVIVVRLGQLGNSFSAPPQGAVDGPRTFYQKLIKLNCFGEYSDLGWTLGLRAYLFHARFTSFHIHYFHVSSTSFLLFSCTSVYRHTEWNSISSYSSDRLCFGWVCFINQTQ